MMIILSKLGKQEKEFIKKIIIRLLKVNLTNVIIKEKRGLLMIDIEKEFSNQICTFCIYNGLEKCGEIQSEKRFNLNIYRCLNYKRKKVGIKKCYNAKNVVNNIFVN